MTTRLPLVAMASALLLIAGTAHADNTTLYVRNNTSGYITVNVDGNYGCNTAAETTCSIPVKVGEHELHATRSDTGASVSKTQDITASGYTWEPWQ